MSPPRPATKLTDTKLQSLKAPQTGQTEVSDSDVPGLRVRIGTTGTKTFILRKRVAGRIKNITLGRYGPRFTLSEARRKARSLISDLEAGKAPPPPRAASQQTAGTIGELVPDYLEAKAHLRSIDDVERVFRMFVLPELKDRLADTVTRADVTRIIDQIAKTKPIRARYVHAQLSAFYSWAMPRLERLAANPCRDAGRPEKAKARDRVLTNAELAGLWAVAEGEGFPFGPALKLLILTGTRRDEVFQAYRNEFDLAAKVWVIPGERSKNGQPHLVPLSDAVVAVIESIPESEGSARLFPSRSNPENGASGYSKAQARFRVKLNAVMGREVDDWRLHDIRRTVATGLQRLGVRFEVTEAVLNHISGSKSGVAGVYQRHDWKAEKRAALDAWACELEQIVSGRDETNVVPLVRA